MNQDMLARVLACEQLPTLPAIAMRVIEQTANVNVRLDELAATIQDDQGLAAKVLKTVNSSFYGLRKPCSTINQALVMLGLSAVKNLALSFSLVSSVGAKGDGAFDYVSYWRRALYSAVAAKTVAHRAGLSTEDEAFLGGLLQDIGMVALYRGARREYAAVLEAVGGQHRALVKNELALMEVQHPDVGAMLAQRWKLPDDLVVPVKYHERPTAAPAEHVALVRAVGLGNIIHDTLTDDDAEPALRRLYARGGEWFGLDERSCDEILAQVGVHAREMSVIFRLDTGDGADVEQILAKARAQEEHLRASHERAEPSGRLSGLVTDADQVDVLTGVATRLAGLKRAEEAFESSRGNGRCLSILAASIDGFPGVLAEHGMEGGDIGLVETASVLQDRLEAQGGIVVRWDSGLFVTVLPGMDRADTVRAAEEIRQAVQHLSTTWLGRSGKAVRVSLSLGVATAEGSGSPFVKVQQLLAAAVRGAEAASGSGGNAVRAFTPRSAAAA